MRAIIWTPNPEDRTELLREEVEFDERTPEGAKLWGYAHGWQDVMNKSKKTMTRFQAYGAHDSHYGQGYVDGAKAARKYKFWLNASDAQKKFMIMRAKEGPRFDPMAHFLPG